MKNNIKKTVPSKDRTVHKPSVSVEAAEKAAEAAKKNTQILKRKYKEAWHAYKKARKDAKALEKKARHVRKEWDERCGKNNKDKTKAVTTNTASNKSRKAVLKSKPRTQHPKNSPVPATTHIEHATPTVAPDSHAAAATLTPNTSVSSGTES